MNILCIYIFSLFKSWIEVKKENFWTGYETYRQFSKLLIANKNHGHLTLTVEGLQRGPKGRRQSESVASNKVE
jgi:hypothetical protein